VNNPSPLRLTSEFSDVVVVIDPHSGAPLGLETGGRDFISSAVLSVTTGGDEVRGVMGGLVYEGCHTTAIKPAELASHLSTWVRATESTASRPLPILRSLSSGPTGFRARFLECQSPSMS